MGSIAVDRVIAKSIQLQGLPIGKTPIIRYDSQEPTLNTGGSTVKVNVVAAISPSYVVGGVEHSQVTLSWSSFRFTPNASSVNALVRLNKVYLPEIGAGGCCPAFLSSAGNSNAEMAVTVTVGDAGDNFYDSTFYAQLVFNRLNGKTFNEFTDCIISSGSITYWIPTPAYDHGQGVGPSA